MRKETFAILVIRFVLGSSSTCKDNPSQVQCLAHNNRFLLPRNSNCNPFRNNCRMGDLVDDRIASCALKYTGNIQHSLQERYSIGGMQRCIPEIRSQKDYGSRVVSVDTVEPLCTGVEKKGKGVFTCGFKGTRCVCDAPKAGKDPTLNKCRCQYFIDFCAVAQACTDPEAVCLTQSNTITCTCPSTSKTCSPGISQCVADPSLCGEHGEECIELYDQFSSWVIGRKTIQDGYACVNVEDMKLLQRETHYCGVSSTQLSTAKKAKNHIDACCFRQLLCGSEDNSIKGNILSYRPCYCNTLFRNCLRRYGGMTAYRDIADAAIRTLNQQKTCSINDGQCDPRQPGTCSKGDFISPKIAHCQINCKSGPLLPIGKRMCSIRQCTPSTHVYGVRIIDIPNRRTSSVCEAVRTLPVLCGKSDTRCVCDSRPSGLTFTDRCRCQYWPLSI